MKQFQNQYGILRYHDLDGEKTPILFIHGLGCCGSMDYPQIASNLHLQNHRKIIVDLMGSGFSDYSADFDYSITSHAHLLKDLINSLETDKIILYGHSMGGSIAIELAEMIQSKVERLILSEANLDNGGGFFSRKIADYDESDFIKYGFQNTIDENKNQKNELWAKSLSLTFPKAIYLEAKSLVTGNDREWREIFYKLNIPKTFIFGELSLPDNDFDILPKNTINIEIVKRAGHSMAWENPNGLAKAISNGINFI